LVAEDNLANLFLLNSQLQRLGCEVVGSATDWRRCINGGRAV
jgi:CheY-like chemotaxis protein